MWAAHCVPRATSETPRCSGTCSASAAYHASRSRRRSVHSDAYVVELLAIPAAWTSRLLLILARGESKWDFGVSIIRWFERSTDLDQIVDHLVLVRITRLLGD